MHTVQRESDDRKQNVYSPDGIGFAFGCNNGEEPKEPDWPPPSSLRAKLDARRFHLGKPPPLPRTIYSMAGKVICTPGNLMELSANNKTCKTTYLTSGFIGASFGLDGDTLGIKSENLRNYALVHFDTEQSPFHQYRVVEVALSRVGITKHPYWLRSYRLADIGPAELVRMLECELHDANEEHGGIHSVLLDGVADFVVDVNSSKDCPQFVTKLHRLAIEYDTLIGCILHLNPGSEFKSRGHLGSQLERKAESVLRLERSDDGIFCAYTTASRNAPVYKEEGPCFRWSDEQSMHISCERSVKDKEQEKRDRLQCIAQEVFTRDGRPVSLTHSQALARIMAVAGVKERQAGNLLIAMQTSKFIRKNRMNLWQLVQSPK